MVARRSAPTKRVVLLGASNLARSMSTVVETARQLFDEPIEIFSALGHGRSYGMTSSFLGRRLPGIVQCGLWRALDEAPPAETFALVTDVGNDLVYGASVDTIVAWVTTCLDRLAKHNSRITMTALPLESLRALPPWRFAVMRAILFPGRALELHEILARAETLNERLVSLAAERPFSLVFPQKSWFRFDPIHLHIRQWRTAWEAMLGSWRAPDCAPRKVRASLLRYLYLRSRAPQARTLLGIEQQRAQPSGRLADGTTIWLY